MRAIGTPLGKAQALVGLAIGTIATLGAVIVALTQGVSIRLVGVVAILPLAAFLTSRAAIVSRGWIVRSPWHGVPILRRFGEIYVTEVGGLAEVRVAGRTCLRVQPSHQQSAVALGERIAGELDTA